MIHNEFAVSLREALYGRYKPHELQKILSYIEDDAEDVPFNEIPLDFVSTFIHQLFVIQSPVVRASLLRICCTIEENSPDTITETYHFDKLIAISLEQRPPDPPVKQDEEKVAAFRYVMLLIKMRGDLPCSVIRALISLYNTTKLGYKTIVLGMICEAALVCPSAAGIPEILNLLLESPMDNFSDTLLGLISYAFEHNLPLVQPQYSINSLLSPIANMSSSKPQKGAAVTKLLYTWPGLFAFGIRDGAIRDLLRCLSHDPPSVINILAGVLLFQNSRAITDPYTGFVFNILLKEGLIENLALTSDPLAVNFLHSLHPYTFAKNSLPEPSIEIDDSFAIQAVNASKMPSSIINYSLPQDTNQWDWSIIQMFLTVLLPHNDVEAVSSSAKQFYTRLIDFVTSNTDDHHFTSAMSDCFVALIELLINDFTLGVTLLGSSSNLKEALANALSRLNGNSEIPPNSSIWALFRCITILMSTEAGVSILTKWDMIDTLTHLGDTMNNQTTITRILRMFRFYPQPGLAIPVFSRFLGSRNRSVAQLALNELRRKKLESTIIQMLLVPRIIELSTNPNEEEAINSAKSALCEFIRKEPTCINALANDTNLLTALDHMTLVSLLSSPDAERSVNIDDEITWWMEKGIYKYLHIFDRAVECTFLKTSASNVPSIVMHNGCAEVPAHLFGELVKTEKGRAKLALQIDALKNRLGSDSMKNRRAAMLALGHFGSVPETADIIAENQIVETMFDSALNFNSFVLKGTLINSLSLMYVSNHMASLLIEKDWQVFRFGDKSCVIPCDPNSLIQQVNYESPEIQEFKCDFSNENDKRYAKLLIELLDPIVSKKAKTDLLTAYREDQNSLVTSELGLHAMNLLGRFSYGSEARNFVFGLFRATPLMHTSKLPYDLQIAARCQAKMFEILQGNAETATGFKDVVVPKLMLSDFKHRRICARCPEMYLTDKEFLETIGMSRDEFYSSSKEVCDATRQRIFK